MNLQTLFALTIAALPIATAASAKYDNDDLSLNPQRQTVQIISVIEEVFANETSSVVQTNIRIAMCETGGRNRYGKPTGTIIHIEPDGSLRRNPTTGAIGAMQIFAKSHSRQWRLANPYDPQEIRENLEYAEALQRDRIRAGQPRFADWYASIDCWRDT